MGGKDPQQPARAQLRPSAHGGRAFGTQPSPPWPAFPPKKTNALLRIFVAHDYASLRINIVRIIGMACFLALANPKKALFFLLVELKPSLAIGRWVFFHPPKARFVPYF